MFNRMMIVGGVLWLVLLLPFCLIGSGASAETYQEAVPVLPKPPMTNDELDKLIVKLGDNRFNVRERASKDLIEAIQSKRLNDDQIATLKKTAKDTNDEEVRRRIEKVLEEYEKQRQMPAEEFDKLIAKLGDDKFNVREKAYNDLLEAIRSNRLSAGQIATLEKTAQETNDEEVRRRIEKILKESMKELPKVNAWKDMITVAEVPNKGQDMFQEYIFGDFAIKINTSIDQSVNDLNEIAKLTQAASEAVANRDFAAAKKSLEELQDFIRGLDAYRFGTLFESKLDQDPRKLFKDSAKHDDVVKMLQARIDELPLLEHLILNIIGLPLQGTELRSPRRW